VDLLEQHADCPVATLSSCSSKTQQKNSFFTAIHSLWAFVSVPGPAYFLARRRRHEEEEDERAYRLLLGVLMQISLYRECPVGKSKVVDGHGVRKHSCFRRIYALTEGLI